MLKENQSKDLNQNTWAGWSSLHIITTSCIAVQNTSFLPPDPKPAWFDALNSALVNAKAVAADWVDNISVDVTKSVPTAIVDYATDYAAFSQKIVDIAEANPDATGADNIYVKQVNQLIETLLSALNEILTQVDKVSQSMKEWGQKMQVAHDNLSTGAANIQSAEAHLQADIENMNNAIANLHTLINQENKAIAISAAAIGIGIFAIVGGIALAFVTFGAGAVVAGAGIAAVIGGGITWGVMQDKINKQFDKIADDQAKLDQDKRQLVALQGLATASNLAISSISNATVALADFRASWGVFQGELEGIITKLKNGEASLSTLIAETFTQAAEKEWNLVLEFAQSLLNQSVSVEKHQMSIEKSAA
ncbi:MAG TPA: HBL/NHE enterotoxin family protein [Membranihabitans sp.]|nr:HBL/NHE enterotoxin family protein [Membranihabitans sp.]